MKKILLSILLVSQLENPALSQVISADKVPAKVLIAYQMYYPEALHTRWVLLTDSNYGVLFTLGEWERLSILNPSGVWMQHRCNINFENLPEAVKDAAKEKYNGFETREVWKMENSKGDVDYQVFLTAHKKLYVVNFSTT